MLQSVSRVALASLFLLSTVVTADAALIGISEFSTGGGTLVHDGTGDVSSTDGSATGDALLLSSFGITNGNLAADLGLFSITGLVTDSDNIATTANLNVLWLIGTLDGNPLPACSTCGSLNDVNVGSSLGLDPVLGNTQNVLFAVGIVGNPTAGAWVGPGNLGSPQVVPVGQTFVYNLTAAQIAFIVGRMSGFTVDQVRFGLSASAEGISSDPFGQNVALQFDLQGPVPVPEPGTVLLLGSGIAAAVLRRRRRSQLH